MIKLPNFAEKWNYENNFYLSCDTSRIGKFLAHYELYNKILEIPGDVLECGVFKGVSLVRFAMFRELLERNSSRKIVGFDTFGKFPKTKFMPDKEKREKFIQEAGENSISISQLRSVFRHKNLDKNIELVKGNILKTIPKFIKANKRLKISMLHLDTDIYEPSKIVLENLFPFIVKGGILVMDDYGSFVGETKAVDEYFSGERIKINKFPYSNYPSYIIKEN